VRPLLLAGALLAFAGAHAVAEVPRPAVLEELRQKIFRGATGTIEGRVYLERARPDAPDRPLVGLGVLLVPRSEELLGHLEDLKRAARETERGFRDAAPGVHDAVEEYETELWRAGYPDAAPRTATDATGAFRIDVPSGAWLLVIERRVFVTVHNTRPEGPPTALALDPLARYSTSQFQHFTPMARMSGFDAVSVWMRELDVEPRQTVALELHDRGVWLSGVVEEFGVARRGRLSHINKKR
jgi:hypothetical protein